MDLVSRPGPGQQLTAAALAAAPPPATGQFGGKKGPWGPVGVVRVDVFGSGEWSQWSWSVWVATGSVTEEISFGTLDWKETIFGHSGNSTSGFGT